MFKILLPTVLFSIFSVAGTAMADEGMWPMHMLNQLPMTKISERGLELSSEEILELKEAIVLLGGGTGSFVSPEGLVLTNHHVAYRAIQYQSSAKDNFIANGFLAGTQSQELPATFYIPSILFYFIYVTKSVLYSFSSYIYDLSRNYSIESSHNSLFIDS